MLKKFVSILLFIGLLCSAVPLAAAEESLIWSDVYTYCSAEAETSVVHMQSVGGTNYLFLPSGVAANAVPLYFKCNKDAESFAVQTQQGNLQIESGKPLDLVSLYGEKEEYIIKLLAENGGQSAALELRIVPTNGIGSLFLVSDDPIEHGRQWVEASPDKSNKATGSMFMMGADGTIVYDGELKQIKGRGNSTWLQAKKPYQIKIDKKTDLLQTGDKNNKAKTWVLLTNEADPTLLRNNIVYDLSVAAGLEPGIQSEPVNLFYDGEYRGAYLLCEKVEINDGRIEIADLEGEIETANPDITDFDTLSVSTGKTANGVSYTYCSGITNPPDITGGYLLEMETAIRAVAEKCYFVTKNNNYIVVKSPEYCSKEQMDYIASYYQEFEDTLYHKGIHPTNGKKITDYASMQSMVNCYLINELTKNPDGYRTSTYLYKDAETDVMTFGPIWDYDLSFGISFGEFVPSARHTDGFFSVYSHIGKAMYAIPEFRQTAHDTYLSCFAPLLSDVLLGGSKEAAPLQSFSAYRSEIKKAACANGIIWGRSSAEIEAHNNELLNYITERNNWLIQAFASWSADNPGKLEYYADVYKTDWYYEDVSKATEYGILNGGANGIFAPNDNTTRAQTAKVLYAVSGDAEVPYQPIFPDVAKEMWYSPAVMWAVQKKVVFGHDDHTFRPDDPVTREDFVVMLYRYLGSPAVSGGKLKTYSDNRKVSSYAKNAMEWAAEVGLLRGYEDNTIRPQNPIIRAELATLMARFYEQYVK